MQSTINFQSDKGDNPFKDTTIENPLAVIFDPNEEEKKICFMKWKGGGRRKNSFCNFGIFDTFGENFGR